MPKEHIKWQARARAFRLMRFCGSLFGALCVSPCSAPCVTPCGSLFGALCKSATETRVRGVLSRAFRSRICLRGGGGSDLSQSLTSAELCLTSPFYHIHCASESPSLSGLRSGNTKGRYGTLRYPGRANSGSMRTGLVPFLMQETRCGVARPGMLHCPKKDRRRFVVRPLSALFRDSPKRGALLRTASGAFFASALAGARRIARLFLAVLVGSGCPVLRLSGSAALRRSRRQSHSARLRPADAMRLAAPPVCAWQRCASFR